MNLYFELTLGLAIVDELRLLFKCEQVLGENDVSPENVSRQVCKSNLASKTVTIL